MPVHDWKRVTPGTFHDFHCGWIIWIRTALNQGVLPNAYYAQAEQSSDRFIADILTLHSEDAPDEPLQEIAGGSSGGAQVLELAPPAVRHTAHLDADRYASLARRIAIRRATDDRLVALIEIVSPGNKSGRKAFETFVKKSMDAIERGYHFLTIDLFPPGRRDPQGIHGAIWAELGDDSYRAPSDKPLTLASYAAEPEITAYVEPCAIGDTLVSMPLFLTPSLYVPVPLEETYAAAFEGLPRRWQSVLEAG
jgi:hypothetical protein